MLMNVRPGVGFVDVPAHSRPQGRTAWSGSRRSSRAARAETPASPYIRRQIATYDILNEEGLCLIEENVDIILAETGMEFVDDPEILQIFHQAGADVQGTRVRFEPGMCRTLIQATAPAEYIQHARNAEKSVRIGGNNTVLEPGWGPPFVHNLDAGRRYGTLDDFQNLIKIH